jgi:FKBP-type peptidyl-prolyl cis-trans isomerase FkpA
MQNHKLLLLILFVSLAISACQNKDKTTVNKSVEIHSPQDLDDALINNHKLHIKEEQELIQAYIAKHNYTAQATATGVHYLIENTGSGEKVKLMADVQLKYQLNFIDDSYVYSSDSSGFLNIIIGQSTEPSGLQEALLLMNEGSKAIVIVPSYLAYGLTGDGEKIGGRETLVYHIEILKVRNN